VPSGARPTIWLAEHHRELGRVDLAVAQVQVGAAHRTGGDLEQQLIRARGGIEERRRPNLLSGTLEDDRLHRRPTRVVRG
jgi:hypothetical protein